MARSLAAASRASVHALAVVTIPTVAYAGMVAPAFGEGLDTMLQEATGRTKELPDVEGRAVYGLAGEELAAFGDEVDLLIVGSRGYGPVKRLVPGSTSEYLQRHARSALLVLPRAVASEGSASEHPAAEKSAYARLALDVYLHRLRGAIAAMAAALEGMDVLVFTGGVGEHSPAVRSGAAAGLGFLGVSLDETSNRKASGDAEIGSGGAGVRTLVLASREDLEIARQVRKVLEGQSPQA
jgi:nucleotide-binding universal stress UspA family protein